MLNAEVRVTALNSLREEEEKRLLRLLQSDALFPLCDHVPERQRWTQGWYQSWKDRGLLFAMYDGAEMTAAAIYLSLDWDTRLLGLRSARIAYLGTARREVNAGRAS